MDRRTFLKSISAIGAAALLPLNVKSAGVIKGDHISADRGPLLTGFPELDNIVGGFMPSDFVLVGARRHVGRSMFCHNIALNIAGGRNPHPVGIVSLDDIKDRIVSRLLSSLSEIEYDKLLKGTISGKEWKSVADAATKLQGMPITITDDLFITLSDIEEHIVTLKKGHPMPLLIVDYVHLLKSDKEKLKDRNLEIVNSLKALAGKYNIPIIGIYTIRVLLEHWHYRRPCLSDLEPEIERSADAVILLYRDEKYGQNNPVRGIMEVLVAKNRHGKTGMIELACSTKTMHLEAI